MITLTKLAQLDQLNELETQETVWEWVLENFHGVWANQDHYLDSATDYERGLMRDVDILRLPLTLRETLDVG